MTMWHSARALALRRAAAPAALRRAGGSSFEVPTIALACSSRGGGSALHAPVPFGLAVRMLATGRRKLPPSLIVVRTGPLTALGRAYAIWAIYLTSLLVCVRTQAETAEVRLSALLKSQTGVVGMRLGMANDWGSYTGFTYTLEFVPEGKIEIFQDRYSPLAPKLQVLGYRGKM